MYKLKQIEAALRLLDQYDGQLSKTAREPNIILSELEYKYLRILSITLNHKIWLY